MSFSISVERLIEQWKHDGLIDAETASRLKADMDKRTPGFSLGAVLAILGGLLLGIAIIMLIAANWEDMPRLIRVGLIFLLIWLGYIGGAWRQAQGDRLSSAFLYIVGASSFGAGIALVGQMYHISGDVHSAATLWAAGVIISSLLLRSPVLAGFGAGVACFYLTTYIYVSVFDDHNYLWIGPLLLLAGIATSLFSRARFAAHLWAVFAITWLLTVYFEDQNDIVLHLMAGAGLVLVLADTFNHQLLQRITHFARPLATYGFLLILVSLAIQQINFALSSSVFSESSRDVIYGAVILAVSIAGLALCGRNNGSLRIIAYTAFSIEVLYLAFVTVGSMIGTSAFFLTGGILVLLLAAFVKRMEKRFGRRLDEETQA